MDAPNGGISIHAPAKGATQARRGQGELCRHFNPRSREGSDPAGNCPTCRPRDFNPRSREGSDSGLTTQSQSAVHFNPRSREGSDTFRRERRIACCISIHAPAKGATFSCAAQSAVAFISIHAPAKGATAVRPLTLSAMCYFNPRSREGSDSRLSHSSSSNLAFQSTLPRRERRISLYALRL